MPSVYLLGDSNLVRLQKAPYFKHKFSGYTLQNIAVSGSSVSKGLNNLNEFLDKNKVEANSILIILLGTNDLKHRSCTPSSFDRPSLKKIIKIAGKLFAQIFLCKVLPIPKTPKQVTPIDAVNKWINGFQSNPKVTVVETFMPFFKHAEYFEQHYHSDGRPDLIHLNTTGHRILTDILFDAINA